MLSRVVVGVSGTSGGLAALHAAAAEARVRAAELWAVLAWDVPGGGVGGRGPDTFSPSLALHRADATARLRDALDLAFGIGGPGVSVTGLAVRGTPGAVLVDAARGPECVIVVGTGSGGALSRRLRPSVARYCLAHAPCPVLAVPPWPLLTGPAVAHRHIV
ncbi:universal stress protein [Streptomyces sp. NBC_01341]|uniref:universal stress protein n=1 Tax=Streptomyces sp. NBC_01341 TaxID=2903831 RepID=UPI002E0F629A|nr:universal stress protein [Streptomyces sp. NBC_01341]